MAGTVSDRLSESSAESAEPSGFAGEMKALIIAPAWVGDMVMAHTLVRLLRERQPASEIHVVAPRATAPLGGRMPGVKAVHELAVGHGELGMARRRRLARELRALEFETAYVLPNSFKSALVPLWAGIRRRVGWHGEARYGLLNDRRRLDARRYPRMIDRFMALALPEGAPLPERWPHPELRVDESNRRSAVERLDLGTEWGGAPARTPGEQRHAGDEPDRNGDRDRMTEPPGNRSLDQGGERGWKRDRPVLALCPGAEYGEAKRWPAASFAAVARQQLRLGHAVWVMGSAGDANVAGEIAAAAPGTTDLTGRTSLLDAVDLLSLADAVVTNDSGLMHIACALGRRVVAVFGSTSPEFTPPLGARTTVIENELDCRPCFQRECPLVHLNCLRGIAPERVIAALTP